MKGVRGGSTLRSLHELRGVGRLDAEQALRDAQLELATRKRELEVCRERLAKLVAAEGRQESNVKAAVLQRRQACQASLSVARKAAATSVTRATADVAQAQSILGLAEQAWRDACGQERVVERVLARRASEAKRVELRTEDDDNDERAAR